MKMLKLSTLLVVWLIIGLVGCSDILPHELVKAEEACKEHKGIHKIQAYAMTADYVNCIDGHVQALKRTAN